MGKSECVASVGVNRGARMYVIGHLLAKSIF